MHDEGSVRISGPQQSQVPAPAPVPSSGNGQAAADMNMKQCHNDRVPLHPLGEPLHLRMARLKCRYTDADRRTVHTNARTDTL